MLHTVVELQASRFFIPHAGLLGAGNDLALLYRALVAAIKPRNAVAGDGRWCRTLVLADDSRPSAIRLAAIAVRPTIAAAHRIPLICAAIRRPRLAFALRQVVVSLRLGSRGTAAPLKRRGDNP